MRLFSAVALVLLLPAITACSGMPGTTPDGPTPLFHTNINEEGSKRFTFEAAPLDVLPSRLQEDDSQLSRNSIEVLSGIEPGEQIVAVGGAELEEGQAVRPWVRERGL